MTSISNRKTGMISEKEYDPVKEYQSRFDRYTSEGATVKRYIQYISNLRLLIFVLAVAGAVFLYRSNQYLILCIEIISSFVVFAAIVLWHNSCHRSYDILKKKAEINKTGLSRIKGEWCNFRDSGEDFIDHEHPYTWDLDIFGTNSVFQWICACHTFLGRKLLAKQLSEPEETVHLIIEKQKALKELSALVDWRQELEINGFISDTGRDPEKILHWSEQKDSFLKNKAAIFVFRSLPYFSFFVGCTAYFLSGTLVFFAIMYIIQFVLFGLFHSRLIKAIEIFEKNGPLILAYSKFISTIENQTFTSDHLNNVKHNFTTGAKYRASDVFKSLSKILDGTEVRSSPMVYMLANAVLLWDFQCIIKADRLKRDYGKCFRNWIESIGYFEALSSLSIIRFENPQWAFPSFSAEMPNFQGDRLGHPLLQSSTRVVNDYPFQSGGTVAIITGSNMSGKSTFLRTVGVNLVLAFAGAPVCAAMLKCSPMQIYSSMRVNDDLSSRVSTFYAELLRIKKMVGAVKRGESILFLLDELFRGTNSQDRHDGAVAVLNSLSNNKSMGIISTHDLKLCELSEADDKKFINYHFKEHYNVNSITFDYKLNNGQSSTKNAMFLLKMIGI